MTACNPLISSAILIFLFRSDVPVDIPISIGSQAPPTTEDPLPGALKDIGAAIAESASKSDEARANILSQVNTGLAYNPDSQAMQLCRVIFEFCVLGSKVRL